MMLRRAHGWTPALRWSTVIGASIAIAALAAGCGKHEGAPTATTAAAPVLSWTHFEVPPEPPVTPELIAHGREVFETNCASCHGEKGDGNGRCADFLTPRPRNFTMGTFRFKTTPGSDLPTDSDLFRTVSLGLRGTPMPPWKFLLPEQDRWAAIAYVKTLVPAFKNNSPGGPVVLAGEPKSISADAARRGEGLYMDAGCNKCHGDEGYGDGESSDTLVDYEQRPIRPRNFHKGFEFKRGHTLRDIALTIATGNNGTPMPSFADSLDPPQIWDVAQYVIGLDDKRLAPGTGAQSADQRGKALGNPDIVIKLRERAWHYAPDTITVHEGQVVRVDFQPTDNGLGAGHGFAIDGYDKDVFINGSLVGRPKSVTFVADKPGTFTFYCATQCSTGSLHPHMKGTLVVLGRDGGGSGVGK